MAEFTSVLEFVSGDGGSTGHERTTRGGEETTANDIAFPTGFLRRTSSPLLRLYGVVTRILRVLVRAFYLFPILIIAKIVLFAMRSRQGDYITLVFVELVVALFGVFAIVMLLIAILGPRSKRTGGGKIVFGAPSASDAAEIIAAEAPSAGLHITGLIDAGLEPGSVVLRESWGESEGTLLRHVEASSFIVVPDDGAAPVIVELETAPVVLVHADRDEPSMMIPGIGAVTSLARFTLRQGDRVEVIAREGRPGTHPLLQNASAIVPYRAVSSSLVVTSKRRERVVLRATSF